MEEQAIAVKSYTLIYTQEKKLPQMKNIFLICTDRLMQNKAKQSKTTGILIALKLFFSLENV